jgi:hypothetical protein
VIPVKECMHRLRSYDLSASYADPKPWMEFSERTPAAEAGCPPYSITCQYANQIFTEI